MTVGCVCVCVCAGEAVSTAASPLPRNALISPISAIPNQVKAAHGTEEGNSTHNGNISVLLLCVAFLQLIRSKYLTRGVSVLAPTSVVHLLLLSSPPMLMLICNTDDTKHKGSSLWLSVSLYTDSLNDFITK